MLNSGEAVLFLPKLELIIFLKLEFLELKIIGIWILELLEFDFTDGVIRKTTYNLIWYATLICKKKRFLNQDCSWWRMICILPDPWRMKGKQSWLKFTSPLENSWKYKQFNIKHLYVSKQFIGSGMFLMKHSWSMEDVPGSKNNVHNWFSIHQLNCLAKYLQYDI